MPRCDGCIIVPRHNSALASSNNEVVPSAFRTLIIEAANECKEYHGTHVIRCKVLVVQCHSEGVFWRGLLPLLSVEITGQSNTQDVSMNEDATTAAESTCRQSHYATRTSRAVAILMGSFRGSIRHVQISVNANHDNDLDQLHDSSFHSGDGRIKSKASHDNHAHQIINTSCKKCFFGKYYCCRDIDPNYRNNKKSTHRSMQVILLLPPNPCQQQNQSNNPLFYYSRTPPTRPTNPFTLRLIQFENSFIRLTSLSAYISTLGGGFFLCRYLSTAVSLARHQRAIAIMRGDTDMALKCRINEGYCFIHAGKLNRGKRVIRHVLKDVIELQQEKEKVGLLDIQKEDGLLHHTPERELSELTVIKNMCYSALRFANLIREKVNHDDGEAELQNGKDGKRQDHDSDVGNGNNISSTHDDFQRIRIVKDRTWR